MSSGIPIPMMFLGGVFVPVESLPAGLHVLAYALPLTHSVQAMRAGMGGDTPARAVPSLMALAAFAILFFALSTWILARRLDDYR